MQNRYCQTVCFFLSGKVRGGYQSSSWRRQGNRLLNIAQWINNVEPWVWFASKIAVKCQFPRVLSLSLGRSQLASEDGPVTRAPDCTGSFNAPIHRYNPWSSLSPVSPPSNHWRFLMAFNKWNIVKNSYSPNPNPSIGWALIWHSLVSRLLCLLYHSCNKKCFYLNPQVDYPFKLEALGDNRVYCMYIQWGGRKTHQSASRKTWAERGEGNTTLTKVELKVSATTTAAERVEVVELETERTAVCEELLTLGERMMTERPASLLLSLGVLWVDAAVKLGSHFYKAIRKFRQKKG